VNDQNLRIELRPLTELKPHPKQDEYWGKLSKPEFEKLKNSIATIGMANPILVDATGRIIDGHQRHRACEELGHTEILVRVLVSDTDDHFIATNWCRRSLTPIDKARVITKLFLKRQASLPSYKRRGNVELRKELAEVLGVDERTVSRYLQIGRLPMPIQLAIARDELTQTQAIKIDGLSAAKKQAIAARIDAGEAAATVVRDFLKPKSKKTQAGVKPPSVGEHYGDLLETLADHLDEFKDHAGELSDATCVGVNVAELLQSASQFLHSMSVRTKQANSQREVRLAEKLEKICEPTT
jgi:ParB/RepB/Spo0J family partition protein